ncbi:MAG: DNA-formamidopyrimidine glycosylase, partial [Chloroflexi bacterium]|nr:DNA-formamidopyrimidine glycosylase [Chloroflexota bacterium]
MPELPEVERIARGLEQALLGQRLTGVTVRWPGAVARPEAKALAEC